MRWIVAAWPVVLAVAFFALMLLRVAVVESGPAAYVGCRGCFALPSLSADAWLLSVLAGLLLAMVSVSSGWLARLLGAATTALLVVYIADLFVLELYGIRLFFVDLAIYGLEPGIILEQYVALLGGPWLAFPITGLILAAAISPALLPVKPGRWNRWILAAIMGGGLLLAMVPARPEYVNNWIYANVFQANLASTESERYSDEEARRLQESTALADPHRCVSGDVDRRNVIVVIVESWSAYQSQAFNGLVDWTPRLDELARRYQRFSRFHAGGFSTNEGLVNLLGGVRLWAPFTHFFEAAEFGYAWGIEDSLVSVFNDSGFQTALLTTGPLDFVRKGEWFRDLGFDHVEGNDHPFYSDWPRVSFHAAADEALYRRALEWLDGEADEPYFLALETVSTHQPYIDPETGERDMEAAFRYADEWAAWFHDRLRERGFFDDGVLLITSDHRAMNPISGSEQKRFGPAAASRIPMVLVDDTLEPGVTRESVFKLSDITPSFRQRLVGEACMDELEASLFEDSSKPGNCALHLRGSERGIVDVLCREGQGQVVLDGDNTRFRSHEGLSQERRQAILAAIARDRLAGLARHREETR